MSNFVTAPVLQSPLHVFDLGARARAADASCGVWAHEVPLMGVISLRGDSANAAFVEAASNAVGVKLPTEPCTLASAGGLQVFWLSPDEWMIVTPRGDLAKRFGLLNEALAGIRSQVTDNSGGYTQVVIHGRNARDVLSHCTVYDLAHLGEGRIAGTTFGKTSAFLRQTSDGYTVLLRRSFADYIWRYLERAAQPYGFGISKPAVGKEAGS